MNNFQRVFLIVLDSVGIGAAADAEEYGDQGANTLANLAKYVGGLNLPNLQAFGLGNISPIQGVDKVLKAKAFYTKMVEASVGKDTLTGHWELMGLKITSPFNVFPKGFPSQLIKSLEERTGRKVIGNKVASGTVIIDELGEEHLKTGAIIVYTSADSVLQIAAHEEIVPIEELYEICEIARELTLQEEYLVGRVIARPFIGQVGSFQRTANRHDYALKPFGPTVLKELKNNNYDVIAIGKITDIYDGEGITRSLRSLSNDDGMRKIIATADENFTGLSFVNLVDFDALYGHRRDPLGYAKALEAFDEQLGQLLERLSEDDLLIITADHGNDPTFTGTDHTREDVPLLVYGKRFAAASALKKRESFADVGASIADNFNLKPPKYGESFLKEILIKGANSNESR